MHLLQQICSNARAQKMDLQTVGAYVAFILAALKVLEFFRDRKPKLSVVPVLRSSAEIGNDVILTNASKVPANIIYYELVWAKRGFLGKYIGLGRKELRSAFSLEDQTCNITVDGYSSYTLNFDDESYFDWSSNIKDDLYIKLSIAGRKKPLWLWVTGP